MLITTHHLSTQKGIKNIIKFGKNIPYVSDEEIKSINLVEKSTRLDPLVHEIQIGQEVNIISGTFKGNIAEICSLPSKKELAFFCIFLVLQKRLISQ